MPDWVTGQPLLIAVAVLFGIVFARAQATYWLARLLADGVLHTRFSSWLTGPRVARATELLNRFGPPVVTVSFLTVGFQTVANAAAGLARMAFLRYLPAMVVGCLAWAVLYATVGIAAVGAALALAARSPWLLAGVVVLVAGGVLAWSRRRSRTRAAGSAAREQPGSE